MISCSTTCILITNGQGQKGYCYFVLINKKLYVTIDVVFLKHIPFFSISGNTHDVIKIDLIRIDLFSNDIDRPPFHTPCVVDFPCSKGMHMLAHDSPLSIAFQARLEIIDPIHTLSLSPPDILNVFVSPLSCLILLILVILSPFVVF